MKALEIKNNTPSPVLYGAGDLKSLLAPPPWGSAVPPGTGISANPLGEGR